MESVSELTPVGKGKSYVLPKPSGYQKCPQDSALLLQGTWCIVHPISQYHHQLSLGQHWLFLFLLFKSAFHLSRAILRVVWLGVWVPFLTHSCPFLVCFLTWGMYLE